MGEAKDISAADLFETGSTRRSGSHATPFSPSNTRRATGASS